MGWDAGLRFSTAFSYVLVKITLALRGVGRRARRMSVCYMISPPSTTNVNANCV